MDGEITDEEIRIGLRGAEEWITIVLIRDTLATWQPFYIEPMTVQDAHEILLNVSNLYRVLIEIDRKERHGR